jgi:tetratricopeptide (TPR) repeat protein
MKKTLLTFGIVACALTATAQKKAKHTATINPNEQHLKVYANSLKYGDVQSAIFATQNIIASEGEISTFKDSLALLYYNSNNALSCHLLCKELLKSKPADVTLLELNATSLKGLGATKDAIEAYEKLFSVSQNRYHGYELAQLQFGISRLAEALVTINQSMEKTKELEAKINFNIDKNKQQEVPLNAALLNLKGLVTYELKDEKTAALLFDEALKIMPEFEAAKQNKKAIEALGETKK